MEQTFSDASNLFIAKNPNSPQVLETLDKQKSVELNNIIPCYKVSNIQKLIIHTRSYTWIFIYYIMLGKDFKAYEKVQMKGR